MSTKLGQNVCDYKISNVLDHESNQTGSVKVICPCTGKIAIFDFVYIVAYANIDHGYNIYNIITIRPQMSLPMGQIVLEQPELLPLN